MATRRSVRTVLASVADTAAGGWVAARKAVELAWLFGADVVPYHACYESSLSGGAFFDSKQMAAARRELEVRVLVEWQRAIAEAVARAATREGADLVVAEPRYRSGRSRRGLSRIDWEVARLCPVPLPLARSTAPLALTIRPAAPRGLCGSVSGPWCVISRAEMSAVMACNE